MARTHVNTDEYCTFSWITWSIDALSHRAGEAAWEPAVGPSVVGPDGANQSETCGSPDSDRPKRTLVSQGWSLVHSPVSPHAPKMTGFLRTDLVPVDFDLWISP